MKKPLAALIDRGRSASLHAVGSGKGDAVRSILHALSLRYPDSATAVLECADLEEALEAISEFFETGCAEEHTFDNFPGYRPAGQCTSIGRSRFWLPKTGKELLKKES